MAYSACLLGVFLVAYIPEMCLGVARRQAESEIEAKTQAMLEQIQPAVREMIAKAEKFKLQAQELLDKLKTNADRGIEAVNISMQNSLASSNVETLLTDANATNSKKCKDYVSLLAPAIPELALIMKSCVEEVMTEAENAISFTLSGTQFVADAVTKIQEKSSKCTETPKKIKLGINDPYESYSCVMELVGTIFYYNDVLADTANFVKVSLMYREWAKNIGCCTTISEAESFQYATELYYTETETCIKGLLEA